MMCKAYLTSYKLPIIITRGNNVYGPHQFPEKMIPKFTLLASRGKELPVHGGRACSSPGHLGGMAVPSGPASPASPASLASFAAFAVPPRHAPPPR